MKTFEEILKEHSFFKDLEQDQLETVVGCCMNKVFDPGEMIGAEGNPANHFFIVRDGKVAIQIFSPEKGAITVQTVGPDDIIGWSWLFPPYKWCFDIKAIQKTRTVALDGQCLRKKCEEDHDLGYALMKKFSQIMIQRLRATRMQVLDIYQEAPR